MSGVLVKMCFGQGVILGCAWPLPVFFSSVLFCGGCAAKKLVVVLLLLTLAC